MSESVPPSLREVWTWKECADESTKSLSREALIRYYRDQADNAEAKLGLALPRMNAAEARRQKTQR